MRSMVFALVALVAAVLAPYLAQTGHTAWALVSAAACFFFLGRAIYRRPPR